MPSSRTSRRCARLASLVLAGALLALAGCDDSSATPPEENEPPPEQPPQHDGTPGQLFIMGGGSRTDGMVSRMIEEAGLENGGYGVILPMASSEPTAAAEAAREQFVEQGIENIHALNFSDNTSASEARLDSLRGADLVYLTGGDQRRFMEVVRDAPVEQAIRDSYFNDHLIAGTSAGAAVMSEKMITGDQQKHSEYHPTYRTLETENAITTPGLGFLEQAVVDQHFLYRSRYNRLLTTVLEDPSLTGLGIDESTALLVDGRAAEVVGDWQVVVIEPPAAEAIQQENGKLGARGITLDVYLPGQTFEIDRAEPYVDGE
jgi:cyanophycinase